MVYARSIVALIACTILLAGCQPQRTYSTTLSVTGGLKAGDPVLHEGARIGAVTAIRSIPDGKSEVSFAIDAAHANEVREDSIVVLSADAGPPALQLITPSATTGRPAPPGAIIPGAATEAEAALLKGSEAFKGFTANVTAALQGLSTNLEALSKSPAWEQFHQDLEEVQRQVAKAGAHARDVIDKQLPRLQRELSDLEEQLRREGKSAEAERLRKDLDRLAGNLAASPTPSPGVD